MLFPVVATKWAYRRHQNAREGGNENTRIHIIIMHGLMFFFDPFFLHDLFFLLKWLYNYREGGLFFLSTPAWLLIFDCISERKMTEKKCLTCRSAASLVAQEILIIDNRGISGSFQIEQREKKKNEKCLRMLKWTLSLSLALSAFRILCVGHSRWWWFTFFFVRRTVACVAAARPLRHYR